MSIKLPATILDTNVDASVRRVASVHCKRMYKSFLQEAEIVVHKAIRQDRPWMDGSVVVEKWIGSERWLWNWLESMATITGDTSHARYESDFAKPFLSGTDKAPLWTRNPNVFKRHKAELYFYDNIDRLESRFSRSRACREIRSATRITSRNESLFERACKALTTDWKGMVPAQFTEEFIRIVIRHYNLYRISHREFLYRNRYNRVVWNPQSHLTRPYKQKVAPDRAIAELLRSRRPQEARLHRRGQPIEMNPFFDASAIERMVATLESFNINTTGESYDII